MGGAARGRDAPWAASGRERGEPRPAGRREGEGMIRTMICTDGARVREQVEVAEIGAVLADERALLWLDLERPTPTELQALAATFGFHPLAIEDATKAHQRPKIDRYDTFYFIVFYDIDVDAAEERIDEHELDIFLGRNFLITVHGETIAEIDEVAARFGHNQANIERGVGVLLYSLLDTIVDHYFPVVEHIEARIHDMERRIFTSRDHRQREGLHEAIFTLRGELLELRRVLGPERDVLATLARRDLPVVTKKVAVYFQDVQDHLLRVTDAVDISRDLLTSTLDSYHAQNANTLNQVVRVLTACSIILMSISFIAALYGMNFNPAASPLNMPELNARFGYPLALLTMAVVAGVEAYIFRRQGWL
jgi:magnesium transporter